MAQRTLPAELCQLDVDLAYPAPGILAVSHAEAAMRKRARGWRLRCLQPALHLEQHQRAVAVSPEGKSSTLIDAGLDWSGAGIGRKMKRETLRAGGEAARMC